MFRLSRSTLVLALSIGFASTLAAQTLAFSRADHASHAGARALVSADFNRDGRPDLAHANIGRNTVTLLLGGDGGKLSGPFDIPVGAGPFDLTTGDYNADGIADLAVANADAHSISLLTGRGDGSFTRGSDLPAPGGPRGIATGDVDGNGTADLIYGSYQGGAVRTLLGDGTGAFTSGPFDAGAAARPQGLSVGDFNRDGRLDIAVATVSAGLRVLYGLGGARFTARAITGASSLNVAATADLNGDGWLDIAAASTATARMVIYLGGPSGLARSATYATGASPRGLTIADVNGDGWLDVTTADRQASSISVFRADRAHPGSFLARLSVPAGPGSRSVTAADLNGDGLLDLATGNEYAASVTVFENTTVLARAGFGFSHVEVGTPLHQWGGTDDVWPADFNRDGRLDFAVIADNQLRVAVLLTNGVTVVLPTRGVDRFAVADVNGDGNPDVVAVVGVVHLFTYLGDGRGGFIASPMTALPEAVVAMSIGDTDADGTPDLAMLGGFGNGPVWLMRGNGDGTFTLAATADVGGSGPSLTTGDINRDGRLDVATLLWDGRVAILWGGGAGGLLPGPVIPFFTDPLDFIGNPARIAMADLNRDGYLDILASGPTSILAEHTHIGIALGGPEGPAVPMFLDGTRVSWAFATGDVTMDGRPDIVTGAGEIFTGHGDGTFAAPEAFDYFGTDVRVLDVTHDGVTDIVFAASRGAAGVLVNRRGASNRAPVVSAAADRTVAFADQFSDGGVTITASTADPDSHALSVEWRDAAGAVLATTSSFTPPREGGGSYTYTLVARDGRGGESTDAMILTITPMKEIVLHVAGASSTGSWQFVSDATAAGGLRAYNTNLGLAKTAVPSSTPEDQFTVRFIADPSQTYKLWIRLKAERNNWANDSVWVQFYGATDGAGLGVYSPGTTSGLAVNLEECSGCGVSGWGWEDDGWGAVNRHGVLLRFYAAGQFAVVVQRREDGVSIDQIVLSSEKYLTVRPGAAKNDTTILPPTYVAR